jgi:hypothetical protein
MQKRMINSAGIALELVGCGVKVNPGFHTCSFGIRFRKFESRIESCNLGTEKPDFKLVEVEIA